METKLFFTNSKGNKLCGVLSNSTNDKSRPIIIMLHPFTSSKNSKKMLALQKVFDEYSISSFRFDAYGHGESDGDFEDITVTEAVDDILKAIEYLKEQGYTKIGLVGISFGGLASLIAASKTKDLVVLGLICPVSDYEEVERKRKNKKEIVEWEQRGFSFAKRLNGERLKLNYTFFDDFKNNIAYAVANNIYIPTIIIHLDADQVVPIEQSKKIARGIQNSQLVIVEGSDHFLIDEKQFKKIIKTISGFIIEQSKRFDKI